MLVDNSLSGPVGAAPSNASLAATSRAGTVTVSAPDRAAYSAAELVHGLTTVEVGTGYARDTTPYLDVDLPATGAWAARWYVYMPGLQAAGHGIDEVRWHCAFPDTGLGLVVHETAAGNVGTRLQPDDLDASAIVWDTETGSATAYGQWWRIELVYDGTDLTCYTYAEHDTTGARIHTWLSRDVGRTLRLSGYRCRRDSYLPYGNTSFDQDVQDYQNRLIDLGYPAPTWGADGFYGDEMAGQLDSFAGDYTEFSHLVGAFGSGGGAGAEILAGIDLAHAEDQGDPTPDPLYLSHLAVDTTAIGPASTPGTGATLPATSAVGSSGAKHADTTATVAGEGAVSAPAAKHTATTATLAATGTISAEVSATHTPTFPPLLTTELWIDGAWVDITGDVRTREDLLIRRGRADEASRADPSSLSLLLNNRHGRYSPRNPMSPYHGKIGRNTRIRVRAGELPDPGVTLLADTFDRTETDEWGSPDTGSAWTQTSGDPDQVSVSDGAGHLTLEAIDTFVGVTTSDDLAADFDATWEVSTSTLTQGSLNGALYMSVDARRATIDGEYHAIRMSATIRSFSGSPDGRCRIGADIAYTAGSDYHQISPLSATVQDATYGVGEWLTVRCVLVGPQVRMKVWPSDRPEPGAWIAQGYVADHLIAGPITLHARLTDGAGDTPVPTTVSYRNLRVAAPTAAAPAVRFTGEISSWPPRWDLSDSDVWVPVQAAGIGRRLGQGAKPLASSLRRTLPAYRPLAYWPMEDGSQATRAAEVMGTAGALTTSGLAFAEVDTLLSSAPLPEVRPGARIRSGPIPASDSGAWEVDMLVRMEEAPESTTEQTLLAVHTSTMQAVVAMREWTDGRPIIALRTYDLDGVQADSSLSYIDTSDLEAFGQWNRLRLRSWWFDGQYRVEAAIVDFDGAYRWSTNFPGLAPGSVERLDTRFGSELGDLAIGHITVWGSHNSRAYDDAPHGYTGETTTSRLSRLSVDEGVPILVTGDADTELGPEPRGTFLDGVGAAMAADLGAPGELREELGLSYRARTALYDQDPVITLDYTSGHISAPLEPIDDDQDLRNDVEVKREHGSSYRVVDEDGPLGVSVVGRYDSSITLSLASDEQLPAQAGWRLHLGTVDELRWPTIRVDLANPRMRERIPTILALDAGDRIRITSPPHWAQARDLDLIVQGYEERLGAYVWDLTLTCTPASAWTVGEVADSTADPEPDAPDRADTAGSELAAPADATATLLDVATTQGPEWVTSAEHPSDFPLDVILGGEVVRVTAIADASAGPTIGAGSYSETGATDLIAPAVTAQPNSLLICAWMTFTEPGGTFTLPAEMTGLGGTGGAYSAMVAATEPVEAGDTGTRTAILDAPDAWSAVSVAVTGDGATPAVEETVADRDGADVTLTTAASTEAGWWLLAIHAWDWDPDGVMTAAAPSDTGWVLVADSAQASSDTSRTCVWAKQITEAGVQEVTLPTDDVVADNHARLVVLSGVAPTTTGQAFTVTRSINSIAKGHEAGTGVRLAQPLTIAL